jgi:TrmH family RNA methyltransferase
MLSKNKIKLIKSLGSKKVRSECNLFVAEGTKLVTEIINSQLVINYLVCTQDWFNENRKLIVSRYKESDIVSQDELNRISYLKTPQPVLCITEIPKYELNLHDLTNKLSLLLDNIQDPGNLGTIIRIADWFGIEHIICSYNSADVFNPKVVQASMGAVCRVKIYYEDINEVANNIKSLSIPLYGTSLKGKNIYNEELANRGFIVMGNESKGISPGLEQLLDKKLIIPFFPETQKRSESLNVAVATAIVCSEFRRRLV